MNKGQVLSLSRTQGAVGVQLQGGPTVTAYFLDGRVPAVGQIIWLQDMGNGSWLVYGMQARAAASAELSITSNGAVASATPCNTNSWSSGVGDISIPAYAGDRVQLIITSLWAQNNTVQGFADVFNVTSSRYWSSRTTTPDTFGVPGLGATAVTETGSRPVAATLLYTIVTADLAGVVSDLGTFTCRLRVGASAASRGLVASPGTQTRLNLINLGPA